MKRCKYYSIERIDQHQFRVSVQGRDKDGKERCIQFLAYPYNAAQHQAATWARKLGLTRGNHP